MILDVFANRIAIRRYEACSGREIGADDRWTIPLPLAPATGPYRTPVRAAQAVRPSFAADAGDMTYRITNDGVHAQVEFPAAEPRGKVYFYRLTVATPTSNGSFRPVATFDHTVPQVMDPPPRETCTIPVGLLAPGTCRVAVTPYNSFEIPSPARTFDLTVPAHALTPYPAVALRPDRIFSQKKEVAPDADGWAALACEALVTLPRAFTEVLCAHAWTTLALDIECDQPGTMPATFSLGAFDDLAQTGKPALGSRVYTTCGRTQTCAAWAVRGKARVAEKMTVALYIREGDPARYRIRAIRAWFRD